LFSYEFAKSVGGEFVLRIEDIDKARSRPEWEEQIFDDLAWLGLSWPQPVMRQSQRLDAYHEALTSLNQLGLLYECHCNRRDILEAASAPQEGGPLLLGPDGVVYPGTCRPKVARPIRLRDGQVLRLNLGAIDPASSFQFTEHGSGLNSITGTVEFDLIRARREIGDIVLARRDMGTSYHLSVVVDDNAQRITHVTRGQDLFEATYIHVILQSLLGLPTPIYHHHRLIRDEQGKRLAKRDDARAIAKYRSDGMTPGGIRELVGL
jgi:glutamyl-Q tRNA(Asp) synthetase